MTALAFAALIVFAGYVISGNSAAAASAEDNVNPHYKGGSSFNLAGAGPNVARCGAFPQNVELKATDTYAGSGDSVFIEGDPFILVPNPAICAVSNAHGVPFRVAGGTGAYAGATGTGRFHITSNLTPCNGLTPPSQVWFEGMIKKQ